MQALGRLAHLFVLALCCTLSCLGSRSSEPLPHSFHPGHSAFHVTRLHRYDHSGLESMLEAEAHWHSLANDGKQVAEVFGRGGMRRSQPSADRLQSSQISPPSAAHKHHRRWLRISPVQAQALLEHQEAIDASMQDGSRRLQAVHRHQETGSSHVSSEADSKASSLLNQSSDFERMGSSGKVEYTVSDDKMSPTGSLLQGMQRHIRRHSSPVHGGVAVTGLTSLSSQYVGPVGVGTVVTPSFCQLHNGQTLEFVDKSSIYDHKPGCHLEDESQVWVVFDTGSTNIWVSSDMCRSGACIKKGRHRYNHTRSATYDLPLSALELTVQFGTGVIKGPQAKDDFHIGPFTVFNQTFGMIEAQDGSVFNEVPFEGILGLAFSSMSANGVQPFFDTIIQQKALVHNEFAFYFSVDSVTSNAVFWGGVDPAFYEGPIRYFPVIDPYYWAVELISFRVGSRELRPNLGGSDHVDGAMLLQEEQRASKMRAQELDVESLSETSDGESELGFGAPSQGASVKKDLSRTWKAIVDTGTTFFTAEGAMYNEILTLLPAVRCDQMTAESHPPITFRLRSSTGQPIDFRLQNHQYMTSGSSEPDAICTAAFMRIDIPAKHGPAMVLGECFLRHYFSVFDRADGNPANARVGFARSRHDPAQVQRLMHLTRGQKAFQLPEGDDIA